jgi:hypothetical protein
MAASGALAPFLSTMLGLREQRLKEAQIQNATPGRTRKV